MSAYLNNATFQSPKSLSKAKTSNYNGHGSRWTVSCSHIQQWGVCLRAFQPTRIVVLSGGRWPDSLTTPVSPESPTHVKCVSQATHVCRQATGHDSPHSVLQDWWRYPRRGRSTGYMGDDARWGKVRVVYLLGFWVIGSWRKSLVKYESAKLSSGIGRVDQRYWVIYHVSLKTYRQQDWNHSEESRHDWMSRAYFLSQLNSNPRVLPLTFQKTRIWVNFKICIAVLK